MNLPEAIEMREAFHGSGDKGMALYGYADAGGLGVRMEARRKSGRERFVETWTFDGLPERRFPTLEDLRAAVAPLTEADIIAQTSALYPRVKVVEPDTCGNACRLCPRPQPLRGDPRVKHDTWRVELAYSWKDVQGCSLCDAHLAQFGLDGDKPDAKGLDAALKAEVAERMARAAIRRAEAAARPANFNDGEYPF